jgi:hypothetical protein
MKKKTLTIFFLICILRLNAQIKEINIHCTNDFKNTEIQNLKLLQKVLFGKKEKNKLKYRIKVTSLNDNISINIENNNDLNLLIRENPNKTFKNEQEMALFLAKFINDNTFELTSSSHFINIDGFQTFSNIELLGKKIKKSNHDKITLIWNNGFKPYIFSPEFLNFKLNQPSENTLKLIPKIIHPSPDWEDVLRPDESHYYMLFDSVGVFPSYEIAIYWKKKIGIDEFNNKIYDSILLLKQCLSFIEEKDFLQNKSKTNLALYSINESGCKIAISEKHIANLCYKNWKSSINTNEIPDYEDDSCTVCKSTCLYNKRFSVHIKGCATGIKVPENLSSATFFFQFQCNK